MYIGDIQAETSDIREALGWLNDHPGSEHDTFRNGMQKLHNPLAKWSADREYKGLRRNAHKPEIRMFLEGKLDETEHHDDGTRINWDAPGREDWADHVYATLLLADGKDVPIADIYAAVYDWLAFSDDELDNGEYVSARNAQVWNLRTHIQFRVRDTLRCLKFEKGLADNPVRGFWHATVLSPEPVRHEGTEWLRKFATRTQTVVLRSAATRRAVLIRSGGRCENPGCTTPGHRVADVKANGDPILEVDHIVDLGGEGEDIVSNMIALCPNCHAVKTYGTTAETLRKEFAIIAAGHGGTS